MDRKMRAILSGLSGIGAWKKVVSKVAKVVAFFAKFIASGA